MAVETVTLVVLVLAGVTDGEALTFKAVDLTNFFHNRQLDIISRSAVCTHRKHIPHPALSRSICHIGQPAYVRPHAGCSGHAIERFAVTGAVRCLLEGQQKLPGADQVLVWTMLMP